jgi:hypothetical protein
MTVVDCPNREAVLIDDMLRAVAAPGTWLTGAQRRTAALAALTWDGVPAADGSAADAADDLVAEVATVLSSAAHTVRGEWIASLGERGLDPLAYVEVLGVVARVRALGTFLYALGQPTPTIPPAQPGAPSHALATGATVDGGWVPTVGKAWAPNALSAVPAEHDAMQVIHEVFYLSMEQMMDLEIERDLHRTQIELLAARTSLLNECFF